MMIARTIMYFGRPAILICDGKCEKAWGVNNRPRQQLSDDVDDIVYLADDELGIAPADPGTYEGGQAKPLSKAYLLNKWCARECERSSMVRDLEEFELRDFSRRVYNLPQE